MSNVNSIIINTQCNASNNVVLNTMDEFTYMFSTQLFLFNKGLLNIEKNCEKVFEKQSVYIT